MIGDAGLAAAGAAAIPAADSAPMRDASSPPLADSRRANVLSHDVDEELAAAGTEAVFYVRTQRWQVLQQAVDPIAPPPYDQQTDDKGMRT